MREKLSMDKGWKFHKGNPELPPIVGHQAIYMGSKTERAQGLATRDYYDADWEEVNLPHDYVILGAYDKTTEGNHGFLKREDAWYRKNFILEEADEDQRITLIFDGIVTHSTIWVNGHLMERNFCGYNSFEIDVTDILRPSGETNVIAVKVDLSEFEGWWYEGGGIYRHVWLLKTSKVAVATWGTFVNPIKTDNDWQVEIEAKIINRDYIDGNRTVVHELFTQEAVSVSKVSDLIDLNHSEFVTSKTSVTIEDPTLWDLDHPYMYYAITSVLEDDVVIDTYRTNFAFRTLRFDADTGFYLNGVNTKVKGVCGHQDHGGLGVAVPEQIWELRIKKLKAMGCNAYRCGHTPASTEFLDLCDQYGLMVMDESRWFETSRIGKMQVEAMLVKDRNHPSIFMWSVGNEEPVQSTDVGEHIAKHLKSFVRTYDKSRPVTVALNGGFYDSKVSKACDVIGINYNFSSYDKAHALLPDHPICSPEVGATSNTRSVYENNEAKKHFVAYDEVHAPFGSTHRKAWEEVVKRDFVFGMFVWCGYEYRGESQWPKLFAGGGALDSSGYEKDNYYLFKALWTREAMAYVMPHWNLDVTKGTEVKVMTYTNGDEVELFLNGQSLGRRKHDPINQTEWMVPYEEGLIEVVAYKDGLEFARDSKQTLKAPFQIDVELCDTGDKSSEDNVVVFDVKLKDAQGRLARHIDCDMTFELKGLTLLGTGNGDPSDHGLNQINERSIFRGLCQVIAIADKGASEGEIFVRTKDYGKSYLMLKTDKLRVNKSMASVDREWKISQWWKSRLQDDAIDIEIPVKTGDVNTWEPVSFDSNIFDGETGYRHYYVSSKMPSFDSEHKVAQIKLSGVQGDVTFKVEHNKNYWPLPEPKEFLAITKHYSGADKEEAMIQLDGFGKDEAVLLHIVVKNDTTIKASVSSVEWLI